MKVKDKAPKKAMRKMTGEETGLAETIKKITLEFRPLTHSWFPEIYMRCESNIAVAPSCRAVFVGHPGGCFFKSTGKQTRIHARKFPSYAPFSLFF